MMMEEARSFTRGMCWSSGLSAAAVQAPTQIVSVRPARVVASELAGIPYGCYIGFIVP